VAFGNESKKFSAVIDGYKSKKAYRTDALAAKFLNTFLHQLMKFKKVSTALAATPFTTRRDRFFVRSRLSLDQVQHSQTLPI